MSNSIADRQSGLAEEYPYDRQEPVLPPDTGLPPPWLRAARPGLMPMMLAVAMYSPLWFFRVYLGWRLWRADSRELSPRPLSIRDYMVGNSVVAASLMLARIAPQPDWINPLFWRTWAIVFACVAGVSLISVIPAMLLMFRCRDWRLSHGGLIVYSLVAGAITI